MKESNDNLVIKNKFHLDPRTKIFLILVVSTVAFGGAMGHIRVIAIAISIFLLIMSKKVKAGIVLCLIYFILFYILNGNIIIHSKILNLIIRVFASLSFQIAPSFIMGYYFFATTKISEFATAMYKLKIPREIIIPLSVMFRFFPTVLEEAQSINIAMKMRSLNHKKVWLGFEYRVIPLINSIVRIGEELAAASLSRGIGNPGKRTSIYDVKIGIWDIIFYIIGLYEIIMFVIL